MNNKTLFIILISIFYVFGICAFFFELKVPFALFCATISIILIFTNKISRLYATLLFLVFILGFINTDRNLKQQDSLSNIRASNVVLSGRVESIPQIISSKNQVKIFLNVNSAKISDKTFKIKDTKSLVVINNIAKNNIQIGDIIETKGNLRPPKKASNPSQFDYAKYLQYKDTFSILYSEYKDLKVLQKCENFSNAEEFWWFILQKFDTKRDEIIEKHSKIIKSPNLEILGGIVFGNEAINPPDEIKQNFISSGLLHLLAASGLNVALIFGIWWFLATNLRVPYVLATYLGMFLIVLYTFMTGFPPSILRAAIMLLFVLLGQLIDRQTKPVALIFFVGFIMLLFDPKMFFDVGFQLSFVVTIGLILTVEPICSKLDNVNKKYIEKIKDKARIIRVILLSICPKALLAAFLVPLCAQLFVAPLQMYYFNTFTPWSLFANLCVVPFIGIISFLGFISSIICEIPFIGNFALTMLDTIINPFLTILIKISEFFSSLERSVLITPSPLIFQILIYWAILLFLTLNIAKNFKNKQFKVILLSLILVLFVSCIKFQNKNLEIITFDVGNADAILVKTPNSKYILTDTAMLPYKSVSSAKSIIIEYLRDKNIKELELLVITHFDADHCGGALDILKNVKVKNIILQKDNPKELAGLEIIKYLKENNLKYTLAENNKVLYKDKDTEIKSFRANLKLSEKDREDNENSIVIQIKTKDVNALLMGDCGVLGYEEFKNYIGKIDILKVGHHGAKESVNKEMLERLSPKYSLISSGYNKYGHPSHLTLMELSKTDTKIFCTKSTGAIKISECKNHNCKVEIYNRGFKKYP